jgi:hypothetical protein
MTRKMKLMSSIGVLALVMSLAPIAFDSALIGSSAAFARSSNANPNPNAGTGGPYGPGGRFGLNGENVTPSAGPPYGAGGRWGKGGPLGAKGGGPSGNAGANAGSDSGF